LAFTLPLAGQQQIELSTQTKGTLPLARGGTNQTAWTAARCVRVNAGGTALESAAADCGTGGGAPAWDTITAPTAADLSLSMASWKSTFTSGSATSTNNIWNFLDIASNTGTGYLFTINTAASSTLKPFRICYRGTTDCVTFDTNVLQATGAATIVANSATLATTATTANAGDSATSFFSTGLLEVAIGGTGSAPAADDQVLTSDSTSAATWKSIPDCNTGSMLTYETTGNTWGCEADDVGAGGGDAITVNTTAVVDPDFIDTAQISVDENLVPTPDTISLNIVGNSIGPTQIDETAAYTFTSVTNSITGASFIGPTADPADSGVFRLSNAETGLCWEAAPASTDVCLTVDASEIVQVSGGTLDGADLSSGSVTATQLGTDSVRADELNATGVEAELEAVLDLPELQGQIGDAQIADAAVDGGTGGEIADNTITAADVDETGAFSFSSATNAFTGASFTGPTADPADAGVLRCSNNETCMAAELATPGTDATFKLNTSDQWELSKTLYVNATGDSALTVGSASSTTAGYATIFGGDGAANIEPPQIRFVPSPAASGDDTFLQAGGVGGCLGLSSASSSADTTNCILDMTTARAVSAKTIAGLGSGTTHGTANFVSVNRHATDCTSITDGVDGEQCWEKDADTIYVCEPTAGGCDTAGEWIRVTAAGAGGDSITVNTAAVVDPDFIDTAQISVDENLVPTPDTIAWNIVGNSIGPTQIDETAAYTFTSVTNSITAATFIGPTADPADSGILRASNAEKALCWEASAAGTDVCLEADASEIIQITGGTLDAADLSGTVPDASVDGANEAGEIDIDNLAGLTDVGAAITKTTADIIVSGVEVDYDAGASNAWPRLLNEATPTATDCDAAGEAGRLLFDPDLDTNGSVMVCTGTGGWKDVDDDGGAGGGSWSDLSAPTAAVSMVSSADAETETHDFQSAFATDRFIIKSSTGNPTAGDLVSIEAHDTDVTPLRVTSGAGTSLTINPGTGDWIETNSNTNGGFQWIPNGTGDYLFGVGSAFTLTFNAGATDPVLTLDSSIFNVSTGTIQQGGTAVGITTSPSTGGTAPNWSSQVLNIPLAATASVTAGLLAKTEYDTFNAKQAALNTVESATIGAGGGATVTLTGNVSGTDSVITFGSSSVDVTMGTLKQGGTAVLTSVGDTDIAAGAVDGGNLGEIADGTIDDDDVAAELDTLKKSITILSPVTGFTNQVQLEFGQAVTLTEVSCSVAAATSVTIQLDERARATPNTAGVDVLTGTLACDVDSQTTTSFSNATIAADVPLNLQITAVSGTPGAVRIHIKATID